MRRCPRPGCMILFFPGPGGTTGIDPSPLTRGTEPGTTDIDPSPLTRGTEPGTTGITGIDPSPLTRGTEPPIHAAWLENMVSSWPADQASEADDDGGS